MSKHSFLYWVIKSLVIISSIAISAFILLWLAEFALERFNPNPGNIQYGVTFSAPYARSLGLDPKVVYSQIVEDLKVKNLRLPVYWNEVEKEPGKFDFRETDALLDIAEKYNARVMLVIGYKVPRWPECFAPTWVKNMNQASTKEQILKYLNATIDHFQNRKEITLWQIENEPLLNFGVCQMFDEKFLKSEVDLVRSKDSRPIILTDSGELGYWIIALRYSDYMGTSLYRTVWNPLTGFMHYPFPPLYYRLKAYFTQKIFAPDSSGVFISELQAEPWTSTTLLPQMPVSEQIQNFSITDFRDIVAFTSQTAISEQYLWGVEWWYWMKTQGHSEYWDYAKTLFK